LAGRRPSRRSIVTPLITRNTASTAIATGIATSIATTSSRAAVSLTDSSAKITPSPANMSVRTRKIPFLNNRRSRRKLTAKMRNQKPAMANEMSIGRYQSTANGRGEGGQANNRARGVRGSGSDRSGGEWRRMP
jgi:hypothetical protein